MIEAAVFAESFITELSEESKLFLFMILGFETMPTDASDEMMIIELDMMLAWCLGVPGNYVMKRGVTVSKVADEKNQKT